MIASDSELPVATVDGLDDSAGSGRAPAHLWVAIIVFGVLVAAVEIATNAPRLRVALLGATALTTTAAIAYGTIRARPRAPALWWGFVVALGFLATGTMIAGISFTEHRQQATIAFQVAQLIGFPILFASLLSAARTRRSSTDLDSLLDAMIIGTAFGFFTWRSLLSQAVTQSSASAYELLIANLIPALDIIVIVALLRRILSAARVAPSLGLILGAMMVATTNHLVSGLAVANRSSLVSHAPLQSMAFALLAAAALHPSMRAVTEPDEEGRRRFGAARIGMLALALLATPVVLLTDRFQSGHRVDSTLLIGALCISMIVVVRLVSLAREAERASQRERTRERRFESLVQNSSDLIAVVDGEQHLSYVSPAVTTMLGFTPAEARGINVLPLFHPDDLAVTAERLEFLGPGETSDLNLIRLRHRHGGWRWVEARAVNLMEDASVNGIVVNCRDVTERVQAERLLMNTGRQQASVAKLGRAALAASDIESIVTTAATLLQDTLDTRSVEVILLADGAIDHVVRATDAGLDTLLEPDWPSDQLFDVCCRADDPLQFIDPHPGDSSRHVADIVSLPIDDTGVLERLPAEAGHEQGASATMLAIRVTDQDRTLGAILIRANASRRFTTGEASFVDTMARTLGLAIGRREAEASAHHQALHDSLTTLPNRALFVDRLTSALARMEREKHAVAVLFLDIDHFKVINDSLGHSAGDRILSEVASRLLDLLRPSDTVARFGGDEFTLLLDGLEESDDAVVVAERIRETVGRAISFGGAQLQPTVSIGIAIATAFSSNAESLLRDADAAMYRAKERGRDRVEVFDDTMRDRAILRLRTEIDLRRALRRGELVLHYQPIADLHTGLVGGVEALARWQHPREGLILPSQFISVAEQSGLIGELGNWAMLEAMRQCARWFADFGMSAPIVSINVSARTLATSGLPSQVSAALRESEAPPEHICLEITESALMDDIDHSLGVLHDLRDLGVNLAIDDFGTGYSSLTYVKQLPVDVLKIDQSFIDGLGRKTEDSAIVAAVVRLAATLRQTAVAEGVETAVQLAELRHLDCPMAQGYLFSHPRPVDDVELPCTYDVDTLEIAPHLPAQVDDLAPGTTPQPLPTPADSP